jgi:hypothetical protein
MGKAISTGVPKNGKLKAKYRALLPFDITQ